MPVCVFLSLSWSVWWKSKKSDQTRTVANLIGSSSRVLPTEFLLRATIGIQRAERTNQKSCTIGRAAEGAEEEQKTALSITSVPAEQPPDEESFRSNCPNQTGTTLCVCHSAINTLWGYRWVFLCRFFSVCHFVKTVQSEEKLGEVRKRGARSSENVSVKMNFGLPE